MISRKLLKSRLRVNFIYVSLAMYKFNFKIESFNFLANIFDSNFALTMF